MLHGEHRAGALSGAHDLPGENGKGASRSLAAGVACHGGGDHSAGAGGWLWKAQNRPSQRGAATRGIV
ncbi:hypothetical protein [Brevibacillus brevis]|uniref:hypothetical protein n=1 Tax=Brevibacillus brevis TaxID=1393 RepID=UPI001FD36C4E|nr:hypothetical protein [Brevibacillus brevis]